MPAPIWAWDALGATVDVANSSGWISILTANLTNANLAMNRWCVAIATADASSPGYNVPMSSGGTLDSTVYIPLGTQPDPSTDAHLTIIDPIRQREHDMWQAVYDSTSQKITGCTAGTSFPLGYVNEATSGWGGNAANFPLRRGLVLPSEISAGVINHPFVFGVPDIGTASARYPASHTAPDNNTAAMPEGTWLRLPTSVNVPGLAINAWEKTICYALQKWGMFCRDHAGTVTIYGVNPINQGGITDWSNAGMGTANSALFSAAFPWSSLEVLLPPASNGPSRSLSGVGF